MRDREGLLALGHLGPLGESRFFSGAWRSSPGRAVLAKVKAGGLTHDAGAGTFLGRTVEVFDGFPVGSLVLREQEDGAGFYLHPCPKRARKPRASAAPSATSPRSGPVPAPRAHASAETDVDKALLDAFSQAIAAAISQPLTP